MRIRIKPEIRGLRRTIATFFVQPAESTGAGVTGRIIELLGDVIIYILYSEILLPSSLSNVTGESERKGVKGNKRGAVERWKKGVK